MAVNRASERVLDVEQIDIALPADPNCDDLFVPPADLSDDLRSRDVAHRRVDRDYHRMMDRRQHGCPLWHGAFVCYPASVEPKLTIGPKKNLGGPTIYAGRSAVDTTQVSGTSERARTVTREMS